jgi:hypothetical protein
MNIWGAKKISEMKNGQGVSPWPDPQCLTFQYNLSGSSSLSFMEIGRSPTYPLFVFPHPYAVFFEGNQPFFV